MLGIDRVLVCCRGCVACWRWSIAGVGFALAMVLAVTGCHDPGVKTQQSVRDGRLEEMFMEFQAREEKRPQNLQAMTELDRELRAEHAKRLNETLRMIEKVYLKDKKAWMEYDPVRHERVRSVWGEE